MAPQSPHPRERKVQVNTMSFPDGAPQIELYQRENCIDSHAVRKNLSLNGIDFIAHSIPFGNALQRKRLVQASGRDEVPFMIDHRTGVKLSGKNPILRYLQKEYGDGVTGWPRAWPEQFGERIEAFSEALNKQLKNNSDEIRFRLKTPLTDAQTLAYRWKESLNLAGKNFKKSFHLLRNLYTSVREEVRKEGKRETAELKKRRETSKRPEEKSTPEFSKAA